MVQLSKKIDSTSLVRANGEFWEEKGTESITHTHTHTHTHTVDDNRVCELLCQGKVGNRQHSTPPVIHRLCEERALALIVVLVIYVPSTTLVVERVVRELATYRAAWHRDGEEKTRYPLA
jgi:hypothetical protein